MRHLFPLLLLALTFVSGPVVASAQSLQATGLTYSFTPQVVGEQQVYVLMPIPTDQIRANAPLASILPTAFGILRQGKAATYGNSSLRVTDQDLAERRVVVHIDPAAQPYFAIIAAETVYTMSHYGIERVVFPGLADQGLTRADVPFGAFRFQMPMWQALPPTRLFHTDIRLPGGTLVDSAEFYARLEGNDVALTRLVLDYLESEQSFEVAGALAALRNLDVPGADLAVLRLLDSREGSLRTTALELVGRSQERAVWDRLVSALSSDSDPDLSRILELVAEAPFEELQIHVLYHRAEFGEPASRVAALRALAEDPDPRAEARLIGYLRADPAEFALAALEALILRGSWAVVSGLLEQEDLREAIRMQAALALSSTDDPTLQLQGLRYRLLDQTGGPAIVTLNQVAAVQSPGAEVVLVEMLEHPDEEVQARSAQILADRGATATLPAVAARAQSSDLGPEAAEVFRRAVLTLLLEQGPAAVSQAAEARARDPWMRRIAYEAFGTLISEGRAPADALSTIEAGTADSDVEIRAASARALGPIGSPEAFERLFALLDDEATPVRAAAAEAFGHFRSEEQVARSAPLLSNLAQGAEPEVQAGALLAVGELGMTGLMPLVLDRVDASSPQVRASAMRAAQRLADERNARSAINAVAGRLRDPHLPNRVIAAEVLGDFRSDQAVLTLSQVIQDQDPRVRQATIAALGRSGQRSAIGLLVGLLEERDNDIRVAALAALRELGLRAAVPELQAILPRVDDETTRQMAQDLIAWLESEGA